MRIGLSCAATLLLAFAACGKHEDENAPDPRKAPPIPARNDGSKPAAPANPSPSPAPPSPSSPAPSPASPSPSPSPSPKPAPPTAAPKGPVITVKTATPLKKDVIVRSEYTGQTIGSETVDVRARVEGYLESISFTEGKFVKKGDVLYQIEKQKAQEVVEQAEGA